MQQDIFQFIFDEISQYCPENWDLLIFRAFYQEHSYDMKFYYKKGNDIISCFELYNCNRKQLAHLFIKIDEELSKYRKESLSKSKWSVMTMCIDKTGKIRTDFDYIRIEENSFEYIREWERKFL